MNRVRQELKKLSEVLKPMTWKEKIEHIWTSYQPYIVFSALCVFMLAGAALMIINRQEVVFSGVLANAYVTDLGHDYLTEDFSRVLETKDHQQIQVTFRSFRDLETSDDIEADHGVITGIVSMVESEKLDYLIMDDVAIRHLVIYDFFMDLRLILTEEELLALEDKLRYAPDPNGDGTIPVAVDLAGTEFMEDCVKGQEHLYISFVCRTKNLDECRLVWDHILNWNRTLADGKEE